MSRRVAAVILLATAACFDFEKDYEACLASRHCVPDGGSGGTGGGGAAGGGSTGGGAAGGAAGDAGTPDAGVDAGTTDAGVDAGTTDAGLDAGTADAGLDGGFQAVRLGFRTNNSTCATFNDGFTRCWGSNSSGQLSQPPLLPVQWPPRVFDAGREAVVTVGVSLGCALLDGLVTCVGQLPFQLQSLGLVEELAVGDNHACARRDGGVWCWGADDDDQLGPTVFGNSTTPVAMALPYPARRVFAGGTTSCVQTTDAGLWCWGNNFHLQVSGDAGQPVALPVQTLQRELLEVSIGRSHICALDAPGGRLLCWGRNRDNEVDPLLADNGPFPPAAARNPISELPAAVAAGDGYTCLRFYDGGARCFGGAGAPLGGNPGPQLPADAGPISDLAAGQSHACAIALGAVYCWGANNLGQATNPDAGVSLPPVRVPVEP